MPDTNKRNTLVVENIFLEFELDSTEQTHSKDGGRQLVPLPILVSVLPLFECNGGKTTGSVERQKR